MILMMVIVVPVPHSTGLGACAAYTSVILEAGS